MSSTKKRSVHAGILLVVLGSIILYANIQRDFHFLNWLLRCFPVVFIYIGILKAFRYFQKPPADAPAPPDAPRSFSSPLLWAGFGVLLLIVTLGRTTFFWSVMGVYWPLLVILAGVGKLVDAMRPGKTVRFGAGEIVFLIMLAIFCSGLHQAYRNIPYWPMEVRNFLFHSEQLTTSRSFATSGADVIFLNNSIGKVTLQQSAGTELTVTMNQTVYSDSSSEVRQIAEGIRNSTKTRLDGTMLVLEPGTDDRAVVDLVLGVPRGMTVKVRSYLGDVVATNLENPLMLEARSCDVIVRSHRGGVTVNGINRSGSDVTMESVTGDVTLVNLRNTDVFLFGVTGKTTVSDCFNTDLRSVSCAGDFAMTAEKGSANIKDLKGNLKLSLRRAEARIDNVQGDVEATTSSETLKVARPQGNVTVRNEGGDVILSGLPASLSAKVEADVKNGDLYLRTASIPADRKIYIYSVGGELENEFPSNPLTVSAGSEGPVYSNGKAEEATLKLLVEDGDIHLEKN